MLNILQLLIAQEKANQIFKNKKTIASYEEEASYSLHDFIIQDWGARNTSLYLRKKPLTCKKKSRVIAKLKSKRKKRKRNTHLLNFHPPWLLLHFYGVREHLLE